jgi:hypothetical protein
MNLDRHREERFEASSCAKLSILPESKCVSLCYPRRAASTIYHAFERTEEFELEAGVGGRLALCR